MSRPPFAEPPAELPSTIKISFSFISVDWQSASFPGRVALSKIDLLRVKSLAFLAATLALLEDQALSRIVDATLGFSSKKASSFLEKNVSTAPLTSELPSFAFVCPSN